MKTSATIYPPPDRGCFYIHAATAATALYPDDGNGTPTSTPGAALWEDLGLSAGEFECIIESVVADAPCSRVTLTPLNGSDDASVITIAATQPFAYRPGIRMRDGFTVTLSGTSPQATVGFRIVKTG